ncbi:MAG: TetR/AcrR family transcriptional regulator [Streptomycetaceae bacterium]|nr:TetR/AcrR family transcriptional regulator [Streptomycetaceae bacterium]
MSSPRRMGAEQSEMRERLLDLAEKVLMQEGYAAVGVRRLAREADVTPALVHYYFRTLDDLLVALFRRRAEGDFARQVEALKSADPLRTLWEWWSRPAQASMTVEFLAMANHREAVRAELAVYAERHRAFQAEALERIFAERGGAPHGMPAVSVVVLLVAVSRSLAVERALGVEAGHAEILGLVERFIRESGTDSRTAGGG